MPRRTEVRQQSRMISVASMNPAMPSKWLLFSNSLLILSLLGRQNIPNRATNNPNNYYSQPAYCNTQNSPASPLSYSRQPPWACTSTFHRHFPSDTHSHTPSSSKITLTIYSVVEIGEVQVFIGRVVDAALLPVGVGGEVRLVDVVCEVRKLLPLFEMTQQ